VLEAQGDSFSLIDGENSAYIVLLFPTYGLNQADSEGYFACIQRPARCFSWSGHSTSPGRATGVAAPPFHSPSPVQSARLGQRPGKG